MSQLTAEQEQRVSDCQGLVRHLANQMRGRLPTWIEMDDLISYGQVGLMQAVRDYDPDKGTKFSTFAFYRIRGAIFDGTNKLTWFRSARAPEAKYEQMADQLLESELGGTGGGTGAEGRSASEGDLVSEASLFTRLASSLAVMYLASTDEEGQGPSTDVEDKGAARPWAAIVENETSAKLRLAMEKIPPDAAALIRAVYYEDRTLQEAADRLGISKSWASRMHARSLEQLAQNMRQLDPGEDSS